MAHFNRMLSAPVCPHGPHVSARVRSTALGSQLLLPCFAMNLLLPAWPSWIVSPWEFAPSMGIAASSMFCDHGHSQPGLTCDQSLKEFITSMPYPYSFPANDLSPDPSSLPRPASYLHWAGPGVTEVAPHPLARWVGGWSSWKICGGWLVLPACPTPACMPPHHAPSLPPGKSPIRGWAQAGSPWWLRWSCVTTCTSMAWSPPTTAGEPLQDNAQSLAVGWSWGPGNHGWGAFEGCCLLVFKLLCRELGSLELPWGPLPQAQQESRVYILIVSIIITIWKSHEVTAVLYWVLTMSQA